MLENLNKNQKIIVIVILIFMVCVIIYYLYTTLNNYQSFNTETQTNSYLFEEENNLVISEKNNESEEIIVHIAGCVKNDSIVSLKPNSRIKDAIDAAGGLTKDADLTNINLAYILEDGEKIYIPKKGEKLEIEEYNSSIILDSSNSSSSNKISKININKATQAQLETIPGIGPSTALKIINYRNENGKFAKIEDIQNVSGIGAAKYEKMKEYITIK